MKKSLLLTALTCLCAVGVYAQGTIGFGNSGTFLVTTNDFGGNSGKAVGAHVELYYAPSTASVSALTANTSAGGLALAGLGTGWEVTTPGAATVGTPIAGVFQKTTRTTGTDVAGGAQVYLQVRGWTGSYATWDDAVAAAASLPQGSVLLGWTTYSWTGLGVGNTVNPWLNGTGNPNSIPPGTPTDMLLSASGFNGLVLAPVVVPEPTTFALAGLGLASLLIFRRRK